MKQYTAPDRGFVPQPVSLPESSRAAPFARNACVHVNVNVYMYVDVDVDVDVYVNVYVNVYVHVYVYVYVYAYAYVYVYVYVMSHCVTVSMLGGSQIYEKPPRKLMRMPKQVSRLTHVTWILNPSLNRIPKLNILLDLIQLLQEIRAAFWRPTWCMRARVCARVAMSVRAACVTQPKAWTRRNRFGSIRFGSGLFEN